MWGNLLLRKEVALLWRSQLVADMLLWQIYKERWLFHRQKRLRNYSLRVGLS